jgi:hypothetical protein
MPYLIYSPETLGSNSAPVFAIGSPDQVDETMVQDLRSWGWTVVEHDFYDTAWRRAMELLHAEGRLGPGAGSDERRPSLWEIWNDDKDTVGAQEQRGTLRRGRSFIKRIRSGKNKVEASERRRSVSRGRGLVRTILRQLDCARVDWRADDAESRHERRDSSR